MGYVHHGKPDIFVSYAWVDNQELPDGSPGWVNDLARWLRIVVDREIGRPDACHLWMDLQLPSNARLSPEIEAKVRDSAVMIVVLSMGYLASEWCQKELNQFLEEEIGRRCGSGSPIFVIELSDVTRPPALARQEVVGKRFWVKEPLSQRVRLMGLAKAERSKLNYIYQIVELSQDIAAELKRQKTAEATAKPEPEPARHHFRSVMAGNGGAPPPKPGAETIPPSVYLAEVSDDLEDLRDEVKRYLVQAEYRVLPENRLPDDIEGFENAVRADLDRSVVFVQLLSDVAGRKFDSQDRSRVAAQHDLVAGRSMPVLLWRSRTLDLEKVKDAAHRKLLESPNVMALEIQELKYTIVEHVKVALVPKPAPKEPGGNGFFVVVDVEEDELAQLVEDGLRQRSFGYAFRPREGDPKELEAAFKEDLKGSQALMLVFGQTDSARAYRRVNQSLHILAEDQTYPEVLAVYEGPPPKNVGWLRVSAPNLHIMRCHAGLDPGEIDKFVTFLRTRCS